MERKTEKTQKGQARKSTAAWKCKRREHGAEGKIKSKGERRRSTAQEGALKGECFPTASVSHASGQPWGWEWTADPLGDFPGQPEVKGHLQNQILIRAS